MIEKYIIGTSPIPEWAAERIAQYRKTDGKTGYEFYGTWRSIELEAGDALVKTGRRIEIEYKRNRKENT